MPPPYRLNRPSVYLVTSAEQRHPCKAPNFSVNWITQAQAPEIINTTTGKPERGISQICKRELMAKFTAFCRQISVVTGIEVNAPSVYIEAKEAAAVYQVGGIYLLNASSEK